LSGRSSFEARQHGIERFHHVSTCEVGDLPSNPRRRSARTAVPPAHAAQRVVAADHFVPRTSRRSTCLHDQQLLEQLRPFQFPEKVIPLFVTNALDDKELPLYASTQNRRSGHMRSCRAIELVLDRGREGETRHRSGVESRSRKSPTPCSSSRESPAR
jgi:dTDP-glucose 4,6-dehydratase